MDTRLPIHPSLQRTLVSCVTTGSCESAAPATPRLSGDTLTLRGPAKHPGELDRLLSLATSLAAEGNPDQAIPLFWQAMRTHEGHAGALKVAGATLALGKDYKEVKLGALSAAVTSAQTRDEAIATAELAWTEGNSWDRYALGALHKALRLSTTSGESMEIASLAQGHGRLAGKARYKEIQDLARAQAMEQQP